jgi:hypothetical protein
MRRPALTCLLMMPLLAACSMPLGGAAPAGRSSEDLARNAACRSEAERVITRRDRGQLMRAEEEASRGGTSFGGGVPMGNSATQTESLAQRYELQRMTADCVRSNTPAAPPAPPLAPGGSRGS